MCLKDKWIILFWINFFVFMQIFFLTVFNFQLQIHFLVSSLIFFQFSGLFFFPVSDFWSWSLSYKSDELRREIKESPAHFCILHWKSPIPLNTPLYLTLSLTLMYINMLQTLTYQYIPLYDNRRNCVSYLLAGASSIPRRRGGGENF